MQTYPQYYPQMNNYGQQYNPQQPYMDRLAGLQQYQQTLQQPQMVGTQMSLPNQPIGLNGKMVDAVEQITANDVPMDGSVAIFPKKDMSEIYLKSWTPNGTIATVVFKPVLEEQANNSVSIPSEMKIGIALKSISYRQQSMFCWISWQDYGRFMDYDSRRKMVHM